jgi:hypothetical protein
VIAFIVKLNGVVICTAGAQDLSVLNVMVNAMGRLEGSQERHISYRTKMHVDGLSCGSCPDQDEHLRWHISELNIGDRVEIEIAESQVADPPKERSPARKALDEKRHFEFAKKFYLEQKDRFE